MKQHNKTMYAYKILIITSLVLLISTSTANAEENHKMSLGVKAGFSALTQDVDIFTEGNVGPLIGGNFQYNLSDVVSLGFDLEWESHIIIIRPDIEIGTANTITMLPFLKVQQKLYSNFSSYEIIGIGYNINSFTNSSLCALLSCNIVPQNTFAFKVGSGMKYLLNTEYSLSTEIGWKLNSGNYTGTNKFNASAFYMTFGFRHYF